MTFLQGNIGGCKASPVVITYFITYRNTGVNTIRLIAAAKDMWTLSWCDLQGWLQSLCWSAQFCWEHRAWSIISQGSSEYKPCIKEKGCLPYRPKNPPQRIQELSFHWLLEQRLEIHKARGNSRNKIYPYKPKLCSPPGDLRRMLSMKVLFSAYTVLPHFFHQILLKTTSLKSKEYQRNHWKCHNINHTF